MQVSIVSHPWLQEWEPTLLHVFGRNNVAVSYRAENEAVYSIEALTKLEGANFATLRRVKNKIIETNQINFQTLTETTLEHGEGVLKVWHDTQGKIYEGPSRYQKELYALKSFWQNSITDKNIFIRLGYYYDLPVALTVFYINPVLTEWGVNFMIKSKTRKYFQDLPHGIADAAYLDMFKQLHDRNVAFLNDGELGTEEGTRHHKLSRFRPIEFLKSYNIDITL